MREETGQGQQAVELRGVVKEYRRDEFSVLALNNVDLDIPRKDFLALMGPSGSGKSTMLHLIAGIDRPTAGRLTVLGDDIGGMGEKELAAWRSEHIGYIFQTFNLIPRPHRLGERGVAAAADPSQQETAPGERQRRLSISSD